MFEVSVTSSFSAAHQLRLSDGSAEALHRHNWRVTVTCAGGALDEAGVLVDFEVLRARLDKLLATLNDQNLNTLPVFAERNATAERVAQHIAERLPSSCPPARRSSASRSRKLPAAWPAISLRTRRARTIEGSNAMQRIPFACEPRSFAALRMTVFGLG